MQLFDAVPLGEPRLTRDGYLVADAKIARTGIQLYTGKEVDPENTHGWRDKALVRVYRPESEVFATDAMASFAHRPITDDHPAEAVSSKNWKAHSVGMTGPDIARDGAFIRVPMIVMDEASIQTGRTASASCPAATKARSSSTPAPRLRARPTTRSRPTSEATTWPSCAGGGPDQHAASGTRAPPRPVNPKRPSTKEIV